MIRQPACVGRLVEAFRIESAAEPQHAEVALEVRRDCRCSKVKPARTAMRTSSSTHSSARSSCQSGARRVQQRPGLGNARRRNLPQQERRQQLHGGRPGRGRTARAKETVHRRCECAQSIGVNRGCAAAVVLRHSRKDRRRLCLNSGYKLPKPLREIQLLRRQLSAEQAVERGASTSSSKSTSKAPRT